MQYWVLLTFIALCNIKISYCFIYHTNWRIVSHHMVNRRHQLIKSNSKINHASSSPSNSLLDINRKKDLLSSILLHESTMHSQYSTISIEQLIDDTIVVIDSLKTNSFVWNEADTVTIINFINNRMHMIAERHYESMNNTAYQFFPSFSNKLFNDAIDLVRTNNIQYCETSLKGIIHFYMKYKENDRNMDRIMFVYFNKAFTELIIKEDSNIKDILTILHFFHQFRTIVHSTMDNYNPKDIYANINLVLSRLNREYDQHIVLHKYQSNIISQQDIPLTVQSTIESISYTVKIMNDLRLFAWKLDSKILKKFLSIVVNVMSYSSIDTIIQILSNLVNIKVSVFDLSDSNQFQSVIQRCFDKSTDRQFSRLIWLFGELKITSRYIKDEFKISLYENIRRIGSFETIPLSMIITGLANMRFQWRSLPISIRSILLDNYPIDQYTEQFVSNMIRGLGVMKMTKKDLLLYDQNRNKDVQRIIDRIFNGIRIVSSDFTPQGLSNTLFGLCKLGYDVENLDESTVETLKQSTIMCLKKILDRDKSKSVAAIIHNLGHMRFQWNNCDSNNRKQRFMNDGLANDQKELLPRILCEELIVIMKESIDSMNERTITNLLYGLARLQMQWFEFPLSLREGIFNRLSAISHELRPIGLDITLWSLSDFGVTWSMMSEDLQERLMISLEREMKSFDVKLAPTVIYALSKMISNDQNIERGMINRLLLCINHLQSIIISSTYPMQPIDITNTLYGLAKINITIDTLSPEYQVTYTTTTRNLMQYMNEQMLGNTIWALGKMKFELKPLLMTITESLISKEESLRRYGLLAILQGFASSSDVFWYDLPMLLRKYLFNMINYTIPLPNDDFDDNMTQEYLKSLSMIVQSLFDLEIGMNHPYIHRLVNQLVIPYLKKVSTIELYSDSIYFSLGYLMSGLSKLISWNKLAYDQKEVIFQCYDKKRLKDMNSRSFATLLWSFGRFGVDMTSSDYQRYNNDLLNELTNKITSMNKEELCWSIWALGRMSITYHTLSDDLQQKLFNKLSEMMIFIDPIETGVLVWGILQMKIPVNDFNDIVKEKIVLNLINSKYSYKTEYRRRRN